MSEWTEADAWELATLERKRDAEERRLIEVASAAFKALTHESRTKLLTELTSFPPAPAPRCRCPEGHCVGHNRSEALR